MDATINEAAAAIVNNFPIICSCIELLVSDPWR
jgi:hypothetical protein